MKKQINPTIKAHLLRGAFYLLLLLAVCAIPFALAQRNTNKRSAPAAHRNPAAAARAFSAVPREPNLSPWNIVANYPLISESVSVSSDGTVAYAVGGFAGGFPSNAFNVYDPVADTWTPLPNIPGAFYDAPSVYDPTTNRIYVFGGIDASFNPSAVVQIYDVAGGTWVANGTPMPGARYFAGAAYYGGNDKIYVIAGFDSNFTETNTTWEYDPIADTWNTSRANVPIPLGGSGYSIVGQNIYMAGTWNNASGSTVHYRYDIVADSWTSMAPVPVNIYRPDSASIGTNEYLVGGGNPSLGPKTSPQARKLASTRAPATSYTSTYIYDTTSDSWSTGPNTNVAHSFTGGTAIGTKLIVVTGFDGVTGDTNTVELADAGGGGGNCSDYTTTTGTGTIVPGVTDTGNHCDDCTTAITFPFPLSFYGNSYTGANINSNGNLQFTETIGYLSHGCNPLPVFFINGPVIFGYWDDLMTNTGLTNCTTWANGCGVFTATTGSAPNRTFYIEWHAVLFFDGPAADFEMAFYENNPNSFDIFYGATSDNGSDETSGVQASATGPATTFSCGTPTLTDGLDVTYTCVLTSPTPTPTASPCEGPSQLVASMPIDLYGAAGASDGTYFYAAGGYSFSSGNTLAVFNRYDPVANTWSPLPDMPQSAIMATAVYYPTTNKIYVFGGEDAVSGTNYNITRIYDIASNSWSTGRPCRMCAASPLADTAPPPARSISSAATTQDLSIAPSPTHGNTTQWQTAGPTSQEPRHSRIPQVAWPTALLAATCTSRAVATRPTKSLTLTGNTTLSLTPTHQRPMSPVPSRLTFLAALLLRASCLCLAEAIRSVALEQSRRAFLPAMCRARLARLRFPGRSLSAPPRRIRPPAAGSMTL